MNEKIHQLYSFLDKYIRRVEPIGGSGSRPSLPEMDLYPDDYLAFADENLEGYFSTKLESTKTNELISCVANLKRALEGQIECFLYCFGITSYIKKKNLSLKGKLRFISDIGIFSSRTIERFIILRNKIEHQFKKPLDTDVEAFYDLIVAIVALLKSSINNLTGLGVDFEIYNSNDLLVGEFCCWYITEPLEISYRYMIVNEAYEERYSLILSEEERRKLIHNSLKVELSTSIDELETFTYFFRCLLILQSLDSYGTWEHVQKKVKPKQSKN